MTTEQNNINYATPQMPQMPMGQQPQMAQPMMPQQPLMPHQPVVAQAQQPEEDAADTAGTPANGAAVQEQVQQEVTEQAAQHPQFVTPAVAAQMQQQQAQQQAQAQAQQFVLPQAYQAQQQAQGFAQQMPQMQNPYVQGTQGAFQVPAQNASNPNPKTKKVSTSDGYTTGQKVGWAVLGMLMGIPAILLAWLCNVPTPEYCSDAIKCTVIGLVVNLVVGLIIWGSFMSSIASLMSGGAM